MQQETLDNSPMGHPALDSLFNIVASWRFPLAFLYCLGFYTLLMVSTLLLPTGNNALGDFAEEFKTWCFGFDPATGQFEMAYLVMMLVNPLVLALLISVVWFKQLKEAWNMNKRAFAIYGVVIFFLMAILGSTLFIMRGNRQVSELPFPAEALRTAHNAPDFTFTNQDGKEVTLSDLQGGVVLVTGVYATCGFTCPMIMGQAKRAIQAIPEALRKDLTVVGITLDPERDKIELLKAMATAQQVSAPLFNLVTGDPAQVNDVLDQFNVARSRNPETGVIDHANLFILMDRQGKIAYRFTLGERQEDWLTKALNLLLSEKDIT